MVSRTATPTCGRRCSLSPTRRWAWPHTARTAAVTLVTASRRRPPSLGVLLLRDIKKVFDAHPRMEKLLTEDIIRGLVKMDESPWASIRKGEPIDSRSLASRLRKYGISPKPQRTGEEVFKGYSRAQFEDAWKRYVDDLADDDDDGSPMGGNSSVTSVTDDTDDARVTDVTDTKGATGEDLFGTDWTAPDGSPNGNGNHAPLCDCGNGLTSPEAIRAGKCKPCRDEAMAGYDR